MYNNFMALNSQSFADVPLRNCSITSCASSHGISCSMHSHIAQTVHSTSQQPAAGDSNSSFLLSIQTYVHTGLNYLAATKLLVVSQHEDSVCDGCHLILSTAVCLLTFSVTNFVSTVVSNASSLGHSGICSRLRV